MPTSTIRDPHRRLLGQYWTPEPLADFMIGFLNPSPMQSILDPAVGTGIFIAKYQEKMRSLGLPFHADKIFADELDPAIFEIFKQLGPGSRFNFPNVTNSDYLLTDFPQKFDGIICNPPYTRHHRLSPVYKTDVRKKLEDRLSIKISSLSSEFVYFFLKSLSELAPSGRLVFITPIELFEAAYAKPIVNLLTDSFHPRAVIRFRPNLKVFDGADNNLVITVVDGPSANATSFKEIEVASLIDLKRYDYKFLEDLDSGAGFTISSKFATNTKKDGWVPLSTFAHVTRGIATGNNDYFLFSGDKKKNTKIPKTYFRQVIVRTKRVGGLVLSSSNITQQPEQWLLYIQPETNIKNKSLQNYLKIGEEQEVSKGYLVKTRRKWFHMERRDPAPILFTYLGRINPRFIWNKNSVQALSTFLLIYPNFTPSEVELKAFLAILNSPEFIAELRSRSRTYGAGGVKIEPRELMSVPMPDFSKLSSHEKEKLAAQFDELSIRRVSHS